MTKNGSCQLQGALRGQHHGTTTWLNTPSLHHGNRQEPDNSRETWIVLPLHENGALGTMVWRRATTTQTINLIAVFRQQTVRPGELRPACFETPRWTTPQERQARGPPGKVNSSSLWRGWSGSLGGQSDSSTTWKRWNPSWLLHHCLKNGPRQYGSNEQYKLRRPRRGSVPLPERRQEQQQLTLEVHRGCVGAADDLYPFAL